MSTSAYMVTDRTEARSLPPEFLNAYEIANANDLSWKVSLYKVEPANGRPLEHEERGEVKDIAWRLRDQYKSECRGLGFIVDIAPDLFAVPARWRLPLSMEHGDLVVFRQAQICASTADSKHRPIISGIIREGIKLHLRDAAPTGLGPLWRHYDRFCQEPVFTREGDYAFCRRFGFAPKILAGGRWVLELPINTIAIDGRSFADYYAAGDGWRLDRTIEEKRGERLNRSNNPVGTQVLRYFSRTHGRIIETLRLLDEQAIEMGARLSAAEQRKLSSGSLLCLKYPKTDMQVPMEEIHLILGSRNTLEDHGETIISPEERESLTRRLRDSIEGIEIFGQTLRLSAEPFDVSGLRGGFVLPPAICVRGDGGKTEVIGAPARATEECLRERTRLRSRHIRRYGFVEQRHIHPLLAYPHYADEAAADRMKTDLNGILESEGIGYRFSLHRFRTVEEINSHIERNGHDAVLVVLPERGHRSCQDVDIHEQVKQRLSVPSQCAHLRNTMPRNVGVTLKELSSKDRRLATRMEQRYGLLILNLLVKHHWLPFLPVDPFHYNVQVGWDVGGEYNNKAVSCFGYGFRAPKDGLIFRPDEIPKASHEPIMPRYLFDGLVKQFDIVREELDGAGVVPDFERSLFLHDGSLLGDKRRSWNEIDAVRELYAVMVRRGWVSDGALWTAVEIMKSAEEWRLFRGGDRGMNPLAGRYLFPYDDENMVLACTTGAQYLTQGTSNPLTLRITDIHGKADREAVVRDIVWAADMCFTKPDVGMRLPWPLHVADAGALQQARSYRFSGITV
jgi:hypothetical protein